MSHLESSNTAIVNFSNGFTLFASITINQQKREGRKVIFHIAQINTPFTIMLGLNKKDDIMVWLKDSDGISFESKPLDKKYFFLKPVFLHFSLIPGKINTGSSKLELGINNYTEQTEINANLGSEDAIIYSIGSNIEGKENAAFTMAALSLYNHALSPEQLQAVSNQLLHDFGGKYG